MAINCPSNQHCLRYEKEENPNRVVVSFDDELHLTKCPEFIDSKFNDLDEMFMMEESLRAVKGVEESGYAKRYGKSKKV